MWERLKFWNQYGYQPDVFRKYGDAVRKSNRGSLRVISAIAVIGVPPVIFFGYATHQVHGGVYFLLAVLLAGLFAAVCAFRKNTPGSLLLASGYLLGVAVYAVTIWSAVSYDTDVFWIGIHLIVGGFMFDYAWRIGSLQILSYIALEISWRAQAGVQDSLHRAFTALYLVISLITIYTLNRARVVLITGREESRRAAETDLLTGLTARVAAQGD